VISDTGQVENLKSEMFYFYTLLFDKQLGQVEFLRMFMLW